MPSSYNGVMKLMYNLNTNLKINSQPLSREFNSILIIILHLFNIIETVYEDENVFYWLRKSYNFIIF